MMKFKFFIFIAAIFIFLSCTKPDNSPEFIKNATGRYLFNSDALIEVYFDKNDLYLKWQRADKIKPLKLKDDIFFVKEMNKKIQFIINPDDDKLYISIVPKEDGIPIAYNYRKLTSEEHIPKYYLNNKEYDKALKGYLAIKQKDSLDASIREFDFNRKGYDELGKDNLEDAIRIFEINAALFPNSSNVFDSLGAAYLKKGDTIQAIINYKKSLTFDSGNRRIKGQIKKLETKS